VIICDDIDNQKKIKEDAMSIPVYLVLNSGGRRDCPVKVFSVFPDIHTRSLHKVIKLPSQEFPKGSSFEEQAKMILPKLEETLPKYGIDDPAYLEGVFFRCPALRESVKGPTLVDSVMVAEMRSGRALMLKHGSEIAFWLAHLISEKYGIKAIFSRGIPTDDMPQYSKMTGHPDITFNLLSHREAVEGTAVINQKRNPNLDSFVLVMLGSAFGVYAWENGKIVNGLVRHNKGPMSTTSIGGIDALTLLDYFLKKKIKKTIDVRKEISFLSGKGGGLQLYNPQWVSFLEFMNSYKDNDPLAKELFSALMFQLSEDMGAARFSMQETGLSQAVPVYFYGGCAREQILISSIVDRCECPLFSGFHNLEDNEGRDPEMEFFISEIEKFHYEIEIASFYSEL